MQVLKKIGLKFKKMSLYNKNLGIQQLNVNKPTMKTANVKILVFTKM